MFVMCMKHAFFMHAMVISFFDECRISSHSISFILVFSENFSLVKVSL